MKFTIELLGMAAVTAAILYAPLLIQTLGRMIQ